MYLKYFGFQRAPFELIPDPDFLFLGESHESALANLVIGLDSGKGFVAITGPVGAGKTTVLRAMLRRLGQAKSVCFLTQPESEVPDLLRAILDGFGQPAEDLAIVDLRRNIRRFLEDSEHSGVLIVDEAHLLSEESMEQLRLLSNLETDDRKLLQIVLCGQPELKGLLSRPRLRPLAQRIEMFYDIVPLDRTDTEGYLERRLRIAGAPEAVGFDEGAIDLIHRCSAGVPRLINLLADRSLVTGYVADTGRINADLVREAYDDLGEVTQSVMPGAPKGSRRTLREEIESASSQSLAPSLPAPADGPTRFGAPIQREWNRPRRSNPRSGSRGKGSERWIAIVSVASIVALATVSLGARVLGSSGDAAAAQDTADTIQVFDRSTSATADASATPASDSYAVHVASFREASPARGLAADLEDRIGKPTHVTPAELETGLWYRVLVGRFESLEEARALMRELGDSGKFAFVRTVRVIRADDTAEATS